MNREITRPLAAWDTDVFSTLVLQPGTVLSACRILRHNAPGAEPYVMEFRSAGHRYSCPLFTFQARTQVLTAAVQRQPVECAVAVLD